MLLIWSHLQDSGVLRATLLNNECDGSLCSVAYISGVITWTEKELLVTAKTGIKSHTCIHLVQILIKHSQLD